MNELTTIIIYTACAGLCIPIGGLLANVEKIRPLWLENEFRHFIIAFGGGILIASVSLVLLPEGMAYVDHDYFSVILLLLGGFIFFCLEYLLGTQRREKPQFIAMLLDFVPESLALGGAFAVGTSVAPLLAILIGLQNLPEGFNAYRELAAKQSNKCTILALMFLMTLLGPLFGFIGWYYLNEYPAALGAVMLFASGGILYLIFQDIAPQSRMRRHWAPPLGAVIGFSVAVLGKNLIS